jgi:alpha-tubulin suppressor-like RCC1 family protein
MSFWKNLCCCIKDDEINVDEGTRLLPISDYDTTDIKKIESPFTIYAFGVHPPGLNMRLIPLDFCRLGISKIACGAEHILMLSETNFVIAAGNNEYGQCARDPDQPLIRDENEIEIPNESPKNLRMTAFNIDKFKVIYK